jgi:hypothetical protein
MDYTFKDHLHNYACWTAARAVQRNFTTTKKIAKAIGTTDLMRIDELNISSAEEYDAFHRICCNQIIMYFKSKFNIDATYGRAAKIVAIYLKTSVIIRNSGKGTLASIIHPPIDRILLTNLHKEKENKKLGFDKINWTELKEDSYFELISKLRILKSDKFWELEEYWSVNN